MKLQKWNPFDEFDKLYSDVNKVFRQSPFTSKPEGAGPGFVPAVDIYEDDEKTELHVEVPGIQKDAIDVKIDNGILTIKGERKFQHEEKKDKHYRLERSFGMFERSFTLPDYVDAEKIEGKYDNGILVLSLPKQPKAKPKKIEIKVT